ncbi:MAG: D-alanyl-D-alanine carboxypeptidase, partial [Lachnospiraceae bacterium]|nr:D-alanyl-D-alanine carboxypeptidase [Lachnospiraceae bacterium]
MFEYMRFFPSFTIKRICLSTLCGVLLFSNIPVSALAARDYKAEAEERKQLPIESNQNIHWPAGPEIGAESAILMEVNSGTVLYSKNIHAKLYPASITKILTALVVAEKCDMNEMVTFSSEAIHSINWREDANMGINVGDSITMEQCLYGLLVGSANEVAYAMAEHICGEGNVSAFSDLMNQKAKELGCTDSNFITPNGIHDENHYTSAHDMALIAQAFFSNEMLAKMSCTTSYHVPQTATQPREDMIVWAKSKLLPGKEYEYEHLIGTKTGYTDDARQTLVSCAQKDGMKLVCV